MPSLGFFPNWKLSAGESFFLYLGKIYYQWETAPCDFHMHLVLKDDGISPSPKKLPLGLTTVNLLNGLLLSSLYGVTSLTHMNSFPPKGHYSSMYPYILLQKKLRWKDCKYKTVDRVQLRKYRLSQSFFVWNENCTSWEEWMRITELYLFPLPVS